MKEEIEHINLLLERFFEGQTSNREEQELYRFFSRDDIPAELSHYKSVIQYFESGFSEELKSSQSISGLQSPITQPVTQPIKQLELQPLTQPELQLVTQSETQPITQPHFPSPLSTLNSQLSPPNSPLPTPHSQPSTLNSQLSPPPSRSLKRTLLWSGAVAASFLLILFSTLFLMHADPYDGSYIIRNGVRITDLNVIRSELIATEQLVIAQLESTGYQAGKADLIESQIMQTMEEYNRLFLENFQDEDMRKEVEEIMYSNF